MSDVMLLGVLRMPLPSPVDPLTLAQFVGRARQAASRIEADAAEIERLRDALEAIADGVDTWTAEGMAHLAREALGPNARLTAPDTAQR